MLTHALDYLRKQSSKSTKQQNTQMSILEEKENKATLAKNKKI